MLGTHPAIQNAVVLTQERGDMQRLVAYLILQPGQVLGSHDLRSYLQDRLPSFMIPSAFVFLDALPLTPNGKVDRRALPVPKEHQYREYEALDKPGTPIEELVGALWCEVLGRTQVGAHDHFFESGGHSLLATQLVARVRALVGVEVPLRAVFEAPTVAEFAQQVEQALRSGGTSQLPPLVARERPAALPLSFAQQRLWFLEQLEPGNTAYLLPSALRVGGELDVHALECSLQELLRRHESLRTTFGERAGQPVQVIQPAAPVSLPVIDLQGLSPEGKEQEVRRLADQEARQPCDLAKGPLLRIHLLRLERAEHVLLLTLHHIITDAWSQGVFVRELATLYRSFVAGQPSPLMPLRIQYADYALWQRQWLQGDVLEEHLAYWKQQLWRAQPLVLPAETPTAGPDGHRGTRTSFRLSTPLSEALVTLSRQEGVTLFMLLLAAFQVLLYRLTGQEDIVVGTDSANRTQMETEGLIGFFVNLLALRTQVRGASSFRKIVQSVRATVLAAYAHQELPFEVVVEHLQKERTGKQTPLVQVLFVLQNAPRSVERLPDLTFESIQERQPEVKFDLAVFLQEGAQGLGGSVVYQTERFQEQTILTWMRRFETLLQGIVTKPDTLVDALGIATEEEKAEQMKEEEKPYRMYKHRLRNRKREALDASTLRFSPTRLEEEQ
jgi:hypothetical protein